MEELGEFWQKKNEMEKKKKIARVKEGGASRPTCTEERHWKPK